MAAESTFRAVINADQHHVCIRVRDMEKQRAFYGEVMGLPYIREVADAQGPRDIWFQAVQLRRAEGPIDSSVGTMDHLAVSVLNIDAIAERLEKASVALESPILHADVPAVGLHLDNVFFRDPEGNRVELVQWTPLRQ